MQKQKTGSVVRKKLLLSVTYDLSWPDSERWEAHIAVVNLKLQWGGNRL